MGGQCTMYILQLILECNRSISEYSPMQIQDLHMCITTNTYADPKHRNSQNKIVLASNISNSRLLPCIKLRLKSSTIQNSFCVMLTFLFVFCRHLARNVLQTIISRGKGGSWWHLLLDGYLLIVHTTVPPVGTILEKNR